MEVTHRFSFEGWLLFQKSIYIEQGEKNAFAFLKKEKLLRVFHPYHCLLQTSIYLFIFSQQDIFYAYSLNTHSTSIHLFYLRPPFVNMYLTKGYHQSKFGTVLEGSLNSQLL